MEYQTISLRWSAPIPLDGSDASPLPSRAGVYEILFQEETSVERVFAGETEDLRRVFISHAEGDKGSEALQEAIVTQTPVFRYWECEITARRREVLAALADSHFYEHGHDDTDGASLVRLVETY